MISPRSCCSPGGHARTSVGPLPEPHPRARPSSRPRSSAEAKCSCATDTSPRAHRSPRIRRYGRSTSRIDGLNRDSRDQTVERSVRAILVEAIEGIAQFVGEAFEGRAWRPRCVSPVTACRSRLGRREPARDQLLRAEDPRLVLVGVEPEPARRPRRAQQPVPLLPGAEELRRGAVAGQLADPQVPFPSRHGQNRTHLDRTFYKPLTAGGERTLSFTLDRT